MHVRVNNYTQRGHGFTVLAHVLVAERARALNKARQGSKQQTSAVARQIAMVATLPLQLAQNA